MPRAEEEEDDTPRPRRLNAAKFLAMLASLIIGVVLLVTTKNLRLNSPTLIVALLFLGPPAAFVALQLVFLASTALTKSSEVVLVAGEAKAKEVVRQHREHRAEVKELKADHREKKNKMRSEEKVAVATLAALAGLPEDARRQVFALVRGEQHTQQLRKLRDDVRSSKLALRQASSMGSGGGSKRRRQQQQQVAEAAGGEAAEGGDDGGSIPAVPHQQQQHQPQQVEELPV